MDPSGFSLGFSNAPPDEAGSASASVFSPPSGFAAAAGSSSRGYASGLRNCDLAYRSRRFASRICPHSSTSTSILQILRKCLWMRSILWGHTSVNAAAAEERTKGVESRSIVSTISTSSSTRDLSRRYTFGMACAAALRTYGLTSTAHLRTARMTTGTITWTRMEDMTRSARARTRGLGCARSFWNELMLSRASSAFCSAVRTR